VHAQQGEVIKIMKASLKLPLICKNTENSLFSDQTCEDSFKYL